MKTLVTGGAGFIGSNLVALLEQEKHEVVVLDNLVSGYRENLRPFPNAQLMVGDVRDISSLRVAARDVEVIFHLAASVGNARSIEHPHIDAGVNVTGTLNVLEVAREFGVRKIVFSSSAGIYGEVKTLPISERHAAEPNSPYGATKLCAEKLCLAYSKLYPSLEAIALRYFNVFGINQRYDAYGNVIPIFAHKMTRSEPITIFGDGEQTRDFVNVADVARANLLAALNRGTSEAFNVGGGAAIKINDLVVIMQQVSGLDARVVHAPLRQGDVRHSLADMTGISTTLGFVPKTDFREALKDYMRWTSQAMKC